MHCISTGNRDRRGWGRRGEEGGGVPSLKECMMSTWAYSGPDSNISPNNSLPTTHQAVSARSFVRDSPHICLIRPKSKWGTRGAQLGDLTTGQQSRRRKRGGLPMSSWHWVDHGNTSPLRQAGPQSTAASRVKPSRAHDANTATKMESKRCEGTTNTDRKKPLAKGGPRISTIAVRRSLLERH